MLSKYQKNQLETQIKLEKLSKRESRYKYLGLLNEYQLYGSELKREYFEYNHKQMHMIRELIHGFGAYKNEEHKLKKMSRQERNNITIKWKKAQKEINYLKQKVAHRICNSFFKTIFKNYFPNHEESSKNLWTAPLVCKETINIYELRQLGIYYDHLILHFMKCNLLPKNFFEIK